MDHNRDPVPNLVHNHFDLVHPLLPIHEEALPCGARQIQAPDRKGHQETDKFTCPAVVQVLLFVKHRQDSRDDTLELFYRLLHS